jgi:hypothetical protein
MTLEEIIKIKEKYSQSLFENKGVTAVGVGFLNDENGNLTKETGIIIYHDIDDKNKLVQLPTELEGVLVSWSKGKFSPPLLKDLLQEELKTAPPDYVPTKKEEDNPRDKEFNPMIGGISGNPDFFYFSPWTGTIGLVVRSGTDGGAIIMSNRHVICGKKPQVGDGVSQPSKEVLSHLAASLLDWKLDNVIYAGPNGVNEWGMDAAIASPTNGRNATIGAIYNLPNTTGAAFPNLNDTVTKSGLTTDITNGTVIRVNVDIKNEDGTLLKNQFTIRAGNGKFSDGGDSGSAIMATTSVKVLGLLWGNNDTTNETVASPIVPILSHFNCQIL